MTALLSPPSLDGWKTRPSGLLVRNSEPEPSTPEPKPVAIEFFAGAGGFSLGFKEAGWHVAAAVEWDLTAACTYLCNLGGPDTIVHVNEPDRIKNWEKLNGDEQRRWIEAGAPEGFSGAGTGWIANSDHRNCRDTHAEITTPYCVSCHWSPDKCGCAVCVDAEPCEHFWIADVRKLTGAEILDALGMAPGEVDAVIGGPPCQGFSMSGKRDVMDPRNSLVFDYARLILEIVPKTFVMENVPGILHMVTPEGPPVVDMFCRILSDGGYGAYEALKRSLMGMPGARAGVRGQPKRAAAPELEDEDGDGQLDLFAEEA